MPKHQETAMVKRGTPLLWCINSVEKLGAKKKDEETRTKGNISELGNDAEVLGNNTEDYVK